MKKKSDSKSSETNKSIIAALFIGIMILAGVGYLSNPQAKTGQAFTLPDCSLTGEDTIYNLLESISSTPECAANYKIVIPNDASQDIIIAAGGLASVLNVTQSMLEGELIGDEQYLIHITKNPSAYGLVGTQIKIDKTGNKLILYIGSQIENELIDLINATKNYRIYETKLSSTDILFKTMNDTLFNKDLSYIFAVPGYDTGQSHGSSVKQTPDGGYIIAGSTYRPWALWQNAYDAFLIKTDSNGNIKWTKIFGESQSDSGQQVLLTSDGNYLMILTTDNGGQAIKVDTNGSILWKRAYNQAGFSVSPTYDNGYIIAGEYRTENDRNIYLLKMDSMGNIAWETSIGTNDYMEHAYSIKQTNDYGYIIAGMAMGTGGSYSGQFIKVNSYGNTIWSNRINNIGAFNDIIQNSDGSYITTGTNPNNNNLSIIKLNSYGSQIWTKSFAYSANVFPFKIQKTSDGGYIMTGYDSRQGQDGYLLRVDSNGNKLWDKTIVESGNGMLQDIQLTSDGKYILTGTENSYYKITLAKIDDNGDFVIQQAECGNYLEFVRLSNKALCYLSATCSDGIKNQGETGIDCGGSCSPCPTCSDGIQNQNEQGIDCAGVCPGYWYQSWNESVPSCHTGVQETCSDGIKNQNELGIDCNGVCPTLCPAPSSVVTQIISTNNAQNFKIVIGADATTADNIASIDIAGLLNIPQEKIVKDTQITTNDYEIVIGGPAVNRIAASLLKVTYPSYGEESGIPQDKGTIKVFNNYGKIQILIAGWNSIDTRVATQAVVKLYDQMNSNDITTSGTLGNEVIE